MRLVYIALLTLFAAVVVVFSIQNTEAVTVSFLTWSTILPLFSVVIGAYLMGMVSGGSVVGFVRHSVRRARTNPRSAEHVTRR